MGRRARAKLHIYRLTLMPHSFAKDLRIPLGCIIRSVKVSLKMSNKTSIPHYILIQRKTPGDFICLESSSNQLVFTCVCPFLQSPNWSRYTYWQVIIFFTLSSFCSFSVLVTIPVFCFLLACSYIPVTNVSSALIKLYHRTVFVGKLQIRTGAPKKRTNPTMVCVFKVKKPNWDRLSVRWRGGLCADMPQIYNAWTRTDEKKGIVQSGLVLRRPG